MFDGFRLDLPKLLLQTLDGLTSIRPRVLKVDQSTMSLVDHHDGTVTIASTGGGSLEVKEADGSPDVASVTQIIVSNGSLTDNGGGSVSITTGGGGGGSGTNQFTVENQTGSTLIKGTVVRDTGAGSTYIQITALSADYPSSALGVLSADVPNNSTGTCVGLGGTVNNLNTNGMTVGDQLYVDPSATGAFTNVAPNSTQHYVHVVGYVLAVSATVGAIVVMPEEQTVREHSHVGEGEGGALLRPIFTEFSLPSAAPSSSDYLSVNSSTHRFTRTDSSGSHYPLSEDGHTHIESDVTSLGTDLAAKAPIASPTFTGTTTAPEFSASGLTGATAASRYVGATASGAPVSGTFAVGDWITDQTGKRWTCTVGGTPGTWVQEPGTGGGGGLYSAYLLYRDQKAQNTAGGTFTSGAWRTRDITTEVADAGNHGSLSANQITLDAGTYLCRITAPGNNVVFHQARLQNVTDSATIEVGTSQIAPGAASEMTYSFIVARFAIGASKALEVQHQCSSTEASDGFGRAANFATEVYTIAEFWKEA